MDKMGRQVDTIKSGLGYKGSPVEGVLPVIGVEMAKDVRINDVSDQLIKEELGCDNWHNLNKKSILNGCDIIVN